MDETAECGARVDAQLDGESSFSDAVVECIVERARFRIADALENAHHGDFETAAVRLEEAATHFRSAQRAAGQQHKQEDAMQPRETIDAICEILYAEGTDAGWDASMLDEISIVLERHGFMPDSFSSER